MKRTIAFLTQFVFLVTILLPAPTAALANENLFDEVAIADGSMSGANKDHEALRKVFDALPGGGPGKISLLTNNSNSWAARWWMLDKAQSKIDTTYFIWEDDIFGMSFLGHLLKKGMEGKKIRIMVDARRTKGLARTGQGQDYMQELIDVGKAEVKVYSPYYKGIADQVVSLGRHIVGKEELDSAAAASNHDKIIVVDGQWCMTGGRNISLNYFVEPKDFATVFRDTDVLVDSEILSQTMTESFEEEFIAANNHTIKGNKFGRLVRRDLELLSAYMMMDQWLKAEPFDEAKCEALRTDEKARKALAEEIIAGLDAGLKEIGAERKLGRWDKRNIRPWAEELAGYPLLRGAGSYEPTAHLADAESVKILDRGSSQGNSGDGIKEGLLAMVKAAQNSIVIQNPYVVLTKDAVHAMAEAGKRGVKITIITNSPVSTDSALTQGFFIEKWPQYMAEIPNLTIKVLNGENKLHAKVGVFDGVLSLVGTYNLDYLSAAVNGEILSATWSPAFAAKVEHSILKDPGYVNELFEYKIRRNADGTAVDADPDTPGIQPDVLKGAKDHIPAKLWRRYKLMRKGTNTAEKILPQLNTLF